MNQQQAQTVVDRTSEICDEFLNLPFTPRNKKILLHEMAFILSGIVRQDQPQPIMDSLNKSNQPTKVPGEKYIPKGLRPDENENKE